MVTPRATNEPPADDRADQEAAGNGPSSQKVLKWLEQQGYPLEFRTGNVFRRHGFDVEHSWFVPQKEDESPREVDVLASLDFELHDGYGDFVLRVSLIVECKWNREPWVIFTAPSGFGTEAAIAQAISSKFAQAALWLGAGDRVLTDLDVFRVPSRLGFAGRQTKLSSEKADERNRDPVYSALQGVVSNGAIYARHHDNPKIREYTSLAAIVFPMIVIPGKLFESYYCEEDGHLMLKEVETTRIGWMGSQEWKRRAVVDVVRESALESVVSRRKIEIEALAKRLAGTLEKMRHKLKEKSRTSMVLRVSPADRGISGFPSLLKSLAANSRNFRWEKPDD